MTSQMIREEQQGNLLLRLTETKDGFVGALIGGPGGRPTVFHGSDRQEVWRRLGLEIGKLNPSYFGFDGARARFLREYPHGFETAAFKTDERNYKVAAKAGLDGAAPLVEAATGANFGEAVLRAYRATNLLSWRETSRLQKLLRGPSADQFVRAAASFALGAGTPALAAMDELLRPHQSAIWTVVTYLPFLWQPERHMFLKPTVIRDFAARVGCPLVYEAGLNMAVYKSLMDLVDLTVAELAPLEPKDRIDVQSFIWVVGQPEPASTASPRDARC